MDADISSTWKACHLTCNDCVLTVHVVEGAKLRKKRKKTG